MSKDEISLLLSTQHLDDVSYPLQPGSFTTTPLSLSSLVHTTHNLFDISPHFSTHTVLRLPDCPPLKGDPPPYTEVHIFNCDFTKENNTRLLSSLKAECLYLEGLGKGEVNGEVNGEGIKVSNAGGFHSNEIVLFGGVGEEEGDIVDVVEGKGSFTPLRGLLLEALGIVDGWRGEESKASTTDSSLGCTPSGAPADAGASSASSAAPASPKTTNDVDDLSSCLLLRGQNKKFTFDWGYVAIPPVKGSLVVFPGYVPHCVVRCPTAVGDEARISIASNAIPFNYHGHQRQGGEHQQFDVTGWGNVNRGGDYNRLHDHGLATWSSVFYVDSTAHPGV